MWHRNPSSWEINPSAPPRGALGWLTDFSWPRSRDTMTRASYGADILNGAELTQRLAAILAADAAGYSRLMALDERATVASLDAARVVFKACIESNRGRVVDMAGDSVLAVFQTAIGATLSALAIQRELQSLGADVPEE